MLFRSRIRGVAKVMLLALLFAQAAVAVAECNMPNRMPAQAIAREPAMPCHEKSEQNANLCLAHCLSGDQSADTPQFTVPVWSGTAPLSIAVVDRWSSRVALLQYVLPRPAAPPPRILFQSFLI
jgi:hypothetical protein